MRLRRIGLALTLLAAAAGAAAQAIITHEQALAANVTSGDTPGYPVTISVPGHCVLKGNLQVPANAGGIFITASNVTLDLNGFSVAGPGTCLTSPPQVTCNLPGSADLVERFAMSGIRVSSSVSGVTVRNGTVRGVRGYGVVGDGLLLQDLVVQEIRYAGIRIGSSLRPSIIRMARILSNAGHGIEGHDTIVEQSVIARNGGHGMSTGRALVIDSQVTHNILRGISSAGGLHSLLRGSDLRNNDQGATLGTVLSQGGNFNGAALF